MTCTLQPATIDELDDIHRIRRAAILGIRSPAITEAECLAWAERRSREDFVARVSAGEVVIVRDGGEAIAWGSTTADRITGLYVHPSNWGRGVARLIVDALESRIRTLGHATSQLRASPNARGFYVGLGYRETGDEDEAGAIRMRKPLG